MDILRVLRYIHLLVLVAFLTNVGISQECSIILSGNVIDNHENEGLAFATIYVQELKSGVATNENGEFVIEDICPGDYHLVISHIGCESKTIFITLYENQSTTFYLEHHDELLDQIEIQSSSSKQNIGQVKYTLNEEILNELNGKSIAELLTVIPGVSMLKTGPNLSKPIINGMYGNRITILNNGIPQEGQQWGNDHAPEIDPNTADKISVYKGSSAIRYGLQSLGGVVIMEPNELISEPHWHGDLALQGQSNGRLYSLHSTVHTSTKLGNIRLTGSYSKSGDKNTPTYYLTNTGNQTGGVSLLLANGSTSKWSRKIYYSLYSNKNGILRGSHIGNISDLTAAINRSIPFFTSDDFSYNIEAPIQVVNHHLLKSSHKYFVNETAFVEAEIGFQLNQRKEYDVRRSNADGKPALDLTLYSQYYDVTYHKENRQQTQSIIVGLQHRYVNNTNNPGTGILPLIPDYLNNQTALYSILRKNTTWAQLELGARAEYRHYLIARINDNREVEKIRLNFLNYAVNLGLKRQINNEIQTTLDISYTSRPPEVNELFSNGLHQGVSGLEIGNQDLVPENSFKIINEWAGHLNSKVYMNASIYYNKINNYIYLQPQNEYRLTIRGAFPVFEYVGTNASISGISGKCIYNVSQLVQWSVSSSYTYGWNITNSTKLIRIPAGNITSSLLFNFGKTKWWYELKVGPDISYTTTPANLPENEDFLAPPKNYFLAGLFLKWRIKRKNNNDVDISLRAENLFNTSYRDYLDRLRYFSDETGRNITLNIKTNF